MVVAIQRGSVTIPPKKSVWQPCSATACSAALYVEAVHGHSWGADGAGH